jgi:hypothetical protein
VLPANAWRNVVTDSPIEACFSRTAIELSW